jgi:phosphonate transport system substrate-binding protein
VDRPVDARRRSSFVLGAVLAVIVSSCATQPQIETLDLTERVSGTAEDADAQSTLRVAVAAILSPEGNIESYGEFASYLSMRLGRPVELVQRKTYEEVNALLALGDVDIGFVCTSAYVKGHDEFGLRLVAAPEIEGETVYRSVLIVPADSTAQSMADLRGSVFAFTDPISTTGRAYPSSLVRALGETPDTFFARTFFTYSHEEAIHAVAAGLADGAGVDSIVLDQVLAAEPGLAIRIIHVSVPFGIPPVVVAPHISVSDEAEIRSLLLGLADDEMARQALEAMGVDRFVAVSDDEYDGVRELLAGESR